VTPGAGRGEAPKGDAVFFLRHEIYKKFVSSLEVGIGMEGLEKCTF